MEVKIRDTWEDKEVGERESMYVWERRKGEGEEEGR